MRIAVIEDEGPIRKGLVKMLPKLNPEYQVVAEAANGVEGLREIERTKPDVVILDVQMPEMDGLSMLAQLRLRGSKVRAIVLTAYSDFAYAKRAIELGIDHYLLKPIRIQEMKEKLEVIEGELKTEEGREKLRRAWLSLEQIFRSCILAEMPVDEELGKVTKERYGLEISEPLVIFSVWLGDQYHVYKDSVTTVLELYTGRVLDYQSIVLPSIRYHLVAVVLYHIRDRQKVQKRYEEVVIPAIRREVGDPAIFAWVRCENMAQLSAAFMRMLENRQWNISFPVGTLICEERLEAMKLQKFPYSIDVEAQLKHSVTEKNHQRFQKLFYQLKRDCTKGLYHPDEIREACVRLCLAVLSLAQALGRVERTIATSEIVGAVTQALTWNRIEEMFEKLYESAAQKKEENGEISELIRRAKKLIGEYYSQGITLEELAQRLHVTEEYLSTQFRKETGLSFTEMVRGYRIDRIKELLMHSDLKLSQIADMVGYSDPKYMSKVFKEEVGVLPTEFRKRNL